MDKKPVLYLAGPMTGYKNFNYDAFHEAAARLRMDGYTVLNPAETSDDFTLSREWFLREAITLLLQCDAIAVLPNWENSRGASLEVMIGNELGMTIYDAATLQPLGIDSFCYAETLPPLPETALEVASC